MSTEGRLADLTAYLDTYLRVRETPDEPNAQNGLQVENSGTIQGIVAAVDVSQQAIDGTGAGSLLVVRGQTFHEFSSQRGATLEEENASATVRADAEALLERCKQ